jgi:hypothetical protein
MNAPEIDETLIIVMTTVAFIARFVSEWNAEGRDSDR